MDALPQRSFRTFKIRDENVPPATTALKTIHQRNKSSPALYTLANGAGAKGMPKRTAFADVSNTMRAPQVKDDSAITQKAAIEILKDIRPTEPLRPVPLNRQAQRPLSVAGIKGFINNLASQHNSSLPKPPITDTRTGTTLQSNNITKPALRATTVLKDELPAPKQLPPLPIVELQEPRLKSTSLGPLQNTSQAIEPLMSTGFNFAFDKENIGLPLPAIIPKAIEHLPTVYSDVRSDGVRLYSADAVQPLYPDQYSHFDGSEIYVDAPTHFLPEPEPEPLRFEDFNAVPRMPPSHIDAIHLLPVSEVEEYWDEDGYEENYEDEGYTTTRSLKSKGDYTTGHTTVILAPRMTAKVEREIAAAKQTVLQGKQKQEVDDDETWDTSMVSEYSEEIFDYMKVLEERMRPNPYYMDSQTEVQWSMRSVLMDWLVQVHLRFNLLPETLFLCVNYIDRFLSCKVVSLGKLQLVGATAIFVAAKYEEINCPSVSEIVYMVDNGYTIDEILKAERFMLSMLQFELGWPGPMSFLRRISKADDYDLETRTLAKYFLEITIMDERFVGCIPSYTAAGAHCLARLMLKKGPWSPAHVYYSNYTYAQLRPLLVAMLSCCEDPQKHHAAIFDKYSDSRFKKSSLYVNQELHRGFVLPLVPRLSIPLHELNGKYK